MLCVAPPHAPTNRIMRTNTDNNYWLKRIQDTVWKLGRIPDRAITLPNEPAVSIGNRIREAAADRISATVRYLRVERGYSYEQLRDRTGLSLQTLYDIEYKKRPVTLQELELLARCYELRASDILGVDLNS